MFSGITEVLGRILACEPHDHCVQFTILHHGVFDDIKIGDSIAVNGVCLTVTQWNQHEFQTTAMPETLRLTNLGSLAVNDDVNLERSITANQRIGGHYVQGHIDTTAIIQHIHETGGDTCVVDFTIAPSFLKYIVHKGYIAIDGMSITITQVHDTGFSVAFIPHTRLNTVVKNYVPEHRVNIEVDMMNKSIEKLLRGMENAPRH